MKNIICLAFVGLLAVASVTGCGNGDPRGYHVQGTVTFNGQPIPYGDIQFIPSAGNSGPPGRARIENGKFDTSLAGNQSTVGGAHTVVINGFDGNAQPEAELPHGNPLLQDHREDIEIPKQGGAFEKDFAISGE